MEDLFKELNELVAMECLGIAIRTESQQELGYVFSSSDFERMELMKEGMERCWVSGTVSWDKESRMWCLPLEVETQDGKQRLGVMALCCVSENGREDDRLMLELVANYVSIVVYNAVELVAQKYRRYGAAFVLEGGKVADPRLAPGLFLGIPGAAVHGTDYPHRMAMAADGLFDGFHPGDPAASGGSAG